jgi:hypothetical protein
VRHLADGRFTAKQTRESRQTRRTIRVAGAFIEQAAVVRMRVERTVATSSGGTQRICRTRARRLNLALIEPTQLNAATDAGHYRGASNQGLPISFDLTYHVASGAGTITNLAVDVAAECDWYGAEQDDPGIAGQIVHLRGLAGTAAPDGSVDVFHAPDEFSAYDIYGTLLGGIAAIDVIIDGSFDTAGNVDPSSELYCGNIGDAYIAHRVED